MTRAQAGEGEVSEPGTPTPRLPNKLTTFPALHSFGKLRVTSAEDGSGPGVDSEGVLDAVPEPETDVQQAKIKQGL